MSCGNSGTLITKLPSRLLSSSCCFYPQMLHCGGGGGSEERKGKDSMGRPPKSQHSKKLDESLSFQFLLYVGV